MRTKQFRRFVPGLIDLYLTTEVTGPFLGGVVFITFVCLMFQALRLADLFIIHGVGVAVLLELVFYFSISFLPMVLPLAFLIAVLLAFGRLSSESELVAMKSNGISLTRTSVPVFAVAAAVVVASLGLNLDWVPWAGRESRSLIIKISNSKAVASIREGTFTTGFFDLLIYADKTNPRTSRMERIFIYDERDPKNTKITVAKEGRIIPVRNKNELGASAVLNLVDGNTHHNDIEGETYERMDFKEQNLYLNVDESGDESTSKPKNLSYHEVMQRLKDPKTEPPARLELNVELWRRYSFAISPLIFVLIGMGFGTVRTRSVKAGAAALTLGVSLVYWGLLIFGSTLAFKALIPPPIALMMPNLVILGIGAWAFRRSNW